MTKIYEQLKLHQITQEWSFQNVLQDLHTWRDRFDLEFKLQVPDIAIAVDRLSFWRLGQFRYGHNALGLKGEITISKRHVLAKRRSNGGACLARCCTSSSTHGSKNTENPAQATTTTSSFAPKHDASD